MGYLRDYFFRGIQFLIGGWLCEIPPLIYLRSVIYAVMFNGEARSIRIHRGVMFTCPHKIKTGNVSLGRGLDINHDVEIDYSGGVVIGEDVWISQGVIIETHEHLISREKKKNWKMRTHSLEIGDNVWIGANAIILPGAHKLGEGSIVAAGAVVTKEVLPYTIVAGVPARMLKEISE